MGRKTTLPPPERLLRFFLVDDHGNVRWLVNKGTRARAGAIAGRPDKEGYIEVRLDGVMFKAHRAVIAMRKGRWPDAAVDVDHINGNKSDNRYENLRECSNLENMQNYPTPKSNSSGFIGVYWNSTIQKWTAQIRVGRGNGDRRRISVGNFDCLDDAAKAQADKKAELHLFNPVTRDGIYANKTAK